jgi:PIN domain nuclease of toxin-antitoxin system
MGATPSLHLLALRALRRRAQGNRPRPLGGLVGRDPFDRLLAAQARSEDLVLASTDPAFTQFEGVVIVG